MRAFLALVHREFLEHRGAFLTAPTVIVGLLVLVTLGAFAMGHLDVSVAGLDLVVPLQMYEFVFMALAILWWLYLVGAVFFYCADAFSADSRNNAMLFWKSMPQTDLKIMAAKYTAATIVLPGLIYLAMLASGLIGYLTLALAETMGPGRPPGIADVLVSYVEIAAGIVFALTLSIAWYAPFLAWVGLLSTVAGRWSVPLSLLIPAMAAVFENIAFRAQGPTGGYIWSYLEYRMTLPILADDIEGMGTIAILFRPFDLGWFVAGTLDRLDWVQVGIGLVFAAAAIFAASEMRRRVIGTGG